MSGRKRALWLSVLAGVGLGVGSGTPEPAYAQTWVTFTDVTDTWMADLPDLTQLDTCEDPNVSGVDECEKDIAIGDVDQDGDSDIIVVRKLFGIPGVGSLPGPNHDLLLRNNSSQQRFDIEILGGSSVTTDARDVFIGDFTVDALPDVVIANTFSDPPRFYTNLGFSAGVWQGLRNDGATPFPDPLPGSLVQYCAVGAGDVNNDGRFDLYFSNYDPDGLGTLSDALLLNDGTGSFIDATADLADKTLNPPPDFALLDPFQFGTGVELHDFDDDGGQDIFRNRALASARVDLLRHEGPDGFSLEDDQIGIQQLGPYMMTAGDLNGDSLLDVYIVNDGNDAVSLAELAGGEIQYPTSPQVLSAAASPRTASFGGNVKLGDIDGDGDLDVGVANADVNAITGCHLAKFALLRNDGPDGQGNLTLGEPWPGGSDVSSLHVGTHDFAFVDLDRNGCLDLFLGTCDGYKVLIREGTDCDVDGMVNGMDNCPAVANVNASEVDCNGDGDVDDPGEGSGEQCDVDGDGIGDACECGDASGDGRVNTTDARLIQRCVAGQVPCSALQFGDVTGDGKLSLADSQLVQKLAVGLVTKQQLFCAERP